MISDERFTSVISNKNGKPKKQYLGIKVGKPHLLFKTQLQ